MICNNVATRYSFTGGILLDNGEKSMSWKDITDPAYVGPGTWTVIHRVAFDADTPEKQEYFLQLMIEICQTFPCHKCRAHCGKYLTDHPPQDYQGVQVEINRETKELGMFLWSWIFHNDVNARLGKPLMDWETAYNLYLEEEGLICSKACLGVDDDSGSATERTSP